MKNILKATASFLAVGVLSVGLAAQTASARYDSDIQNRVTQQLTKKQEFRNLQAATEDGIVTLSGIGRSLPAETGRGQESPQAGSGAGSAESDRGQFVRARC